VKFSIRAALFPRSKAAKKAEGGNYPSETIESLYARQQETLRRVRRGLADVAAARMRVDIRATQTTALMERLQQEAAQALSGGREDLAREALGRRAVLHHTVTELARQHEALREQEEAITGSLQALQERVEGIRSRKETLDASRKAAEVRTTAARSLSGFGSDLAELEQKLGLAEHETAALQATAAGMEELVSAPGPGPYGGTGQDNTETEFDRLGATADIEQQLALLRRSLEAAPPHRPGTPENHP
jgi:phage shock protein A